MENKEMIANMIIANLKRVMKIEIITIITKILINKITNNLNRITDNIIIKISINNRTINHNIKNQTTKLLQDHTMNQLIN